MTRRLNWVLLALIVIIGLPYYWLLIDNRPGPIAPKPVTIAQLRNLASAIPGPAPQAVRVELIAMRRLPGTLFAAGIGIKRRLIAVMVFELTVPGGKPIVIDSGLTKAESDAMGMEEWLARNQADAEQAMARAGQILITHEHPDHLGGLASQPAALDAKAVLNRPLSEELARMRRRPSPFSAPTNGGPPRAVAPGVVVIPAPSHTPGSQMFFVRLQNGREYLFAGDIATLDASWRQLRARSRLVSEYVAPENRTEVYAWLKTIRALKQQAPALVIVPGHDLDAIIDPYARTGIAHELGLPGTPP